MISVLYDHVQMDQISAVTIKISMTEYPIE